MTCLAEDEEYRCSTGINVQEEERLISIYPAFVVEREANCHLVRFKWAFSSSLLLFSWYTASSSRLALYRQKHKKAYFVIIILHAFI